MLSRAQSNMLGLSLYPCQAVFTLKEKVSFNPLRLFANPINLLAYLRGEGRIVKQRLKIITIPTQYSSQEDINIVIVLVF